MRINNVEYPNVSIRVIESKRVVGNDMEPAI